MSFSRLWLLASKMICAESSGNLKVETPHNVAWLVESDGGLLTKKQSEWNREADIKGETNVQAPWLWEKTHLRAVYKQGSERQRIEGYSWRGFWAWSHKCSLHARCNNTEAWNKQCDNAVILWHPVTVSPREPTRYPLLFHNSWHLTLLGLLLSSPSLHSSLHHCQVRHTPNERSAHALTFTPHTHTHTHIPACTCACIAI